MAATLSTMLDLGTKAPEFTLPSTEGKLISLKELNIDKGLLVMFICNHCPYVLHLNSAISEFTSEIKEKGITTIAISSNDVENYPQDSPELMKELVEEYGFNFPYFYDETQEVAKAYKAACTPDFFLFDENLKLVYRGQYDDSRPSNKKPVSGVDLRNAVSALLTGIKSVNPQIPSMGCNIKWKKGNEPKYFNNGK